jgi:hypothetical protein
MWIRATLDQAMLGFGTGSVKFMVSGNAEFMILCLQPAAHGSIVNVKSSALYLRKLMCIVLRHNILASAANILWNVNHTGELD